MTAWIEVLKTWLADLFAWLELAPASVVVMGLVLGPAVGLPVSPFWILAGARFGPWWGTGIGLVGLAGTITFSHLLANGVLRPMLERLVLRRWPGLTTLGQDNSATVVLLCRFSMLPFALQNYAVALSGVPLRRDLLYSVPILSLHLLAFIWLGGALTKGGVGPWLAAGGLLVAAFLVGQRLRAKFAAAKPSDEARPGADEPPGVA